MIERFDEHEAAYLLGTDEELENTVAELYYKSLEAGDTKTLQRILNTYPHEFLDEILCGYPEFSQDELELLKENIWQ